MPGPAPGAAEARVLSEQLHGNVPDDGASARHVCHAPAPQPDTGRREAYAQFSGP